MLAVFLAYEHRLTGLGAEPVFHPALLRIRAHCASVDGTPRPTAD
ncbi:hypothetical protein [Streptomyces glaucosporus]